MMSSGIYGLEGSRKNPSLSLQACGVDNDSPGLFGFQLGPCKLHFCCSGPLPVDHTLLYEDTRHTTWRSQLMYGLFLANYICNGPISKQGHRTRYKGLGLPKDCIETIVEVITLNQLIVLILIFRQLSFLDGNQIACMVFLWGVSLYWW